MPMSYRGMQNNEFALTNDIVGVITMSFLHSVYLAATKFIATMIC